MTNVYELPKDLPIPQGQEDARRKVARFEITTKRSKLLVLMSLV